MNTTNYIRIFRGDDSDALGYQTIVGTIKTDLDLTGCKAVFRFLGFYAEFNPIPEDKKLTIVVPAQASRGFPPGVGYASLKVLDSLGKIRTFTNRIPVIVDTMTPSCDCGEFEVSFSPFPELEPLKIFVGPNADDFDQYTGFISKIIDRANLVKYGLAILADAMSEDGGASGKAASPLAVKAAYDEIIATLTDNYYTSEQTEEAIDRVAAYYITYDAAGNPFPTYAALANATTVYSGGQVRTPTRNDYCVVLADEMHDNAEYRYIYAVADGETTGSWQPQFPVEGVMTVDQTVTKHSQNPVSGGGVWSAIWGAPSALPTGFTSLYDWCVAQLNDKLSRKEAGLSKWKITPSPQTSWSVQFESSNGIHAECWYLVLNDERVDSYEAGEDATRLDFTDYTVTRTNFADALDGKLDKSGGTMTGDLVMSLTNRKNGLVLTKNSAPGNLDWRLFVDSSNRLVFYCLGDWYMATLRRREGTIAFFDEIGIPGFDATATYAVGAKIVCDNAVWNCTTAVSTAGVWNAANWTKLFDLDTGAPASGGTKLITNGQAFTALQGKADVSDLLAKLDSTSAAPAFSDDSSVTYPVGAHVTYNGKLYKCTTATTGGTWVAGSWTADAITDIIPYDRITITTGQLQDHAEQNVTLNAATTTLSLPALTDLTGKVSDFGIDVVNGYEVSGTPTAASFQLDGTLGTDYNLIVPDGENWSEMSTLAAGEMAIYYFTLSAFQIGGLPTWGVTKQVVTLVPVPTAP